MRTVILDADTLIYESARANEHEVQWSPDLWTLHANLEPAIAQLDESIQTIKESLDADRVVLTLTDYDNPWRKQVMPSYKSNRKDVRKPVIFRPMREYAHEKYTTFQRPGLEGDDCIGILMTNPKIVDGEKIAVSIDKDMKTIPGLHVRYDHARTAGSWTPFAVTEHAANYHHLRQAVMGDSTDGYSGCPGIGPVSADKLLMPFLEYPDAKPFEWVDITSFDVAGAWQAIVAAYEKKGLGEDVALQNARVARICRHEDYDYSNRKVNLWNPPK